MKEIPPHIPVSQRDLADLRVIHADIEALHNLMANDGKAPTRLFLLPRIILARRIVARSAEILNRLETKGGAR